jgi:hypothetical protein
VVIVLVHLASDVFVSFISDVAVVGVRQTCDVGSSVSEFMVVGVVVWLKSDDRHVISYRAHDFWWLDRSLTIVNMFCNTTLQVRQRRLQVPYPLANGGTSQH